jgi:hypothetical protein
VTQQERCCASSPSCPCRRAGGGSGRSAATAASRTGWSTLPPGVTASTPAEVGNYVTSRLSGLTLRDAPGPGLLARSGWPRTHSDKRPRHLVAQGLAIWSEEGRAGR